LGKRLLLGYSSELTTAVGTIAPKPGGFGAGLANVEESSAKLGPAEDRLDHEQINCLDVSLQKVIRVRWPPAFSTV
jgi:hypothetical protein